MPNAKRAIFVPRTRNVPQPIQEKDQYFLGWVMLHDTSMSKDANLSKVPTEFHSHTKVFSEQQSQ